MTKDGKSIKISKTDISKYKLLGYIEGRDNTCCKNISQSRRLFIWRLDGIEHEFATAKELTSFMKNNGYPTISVATVQNIANGKTVKSYSNLTGKIQKIRKSEDITNED